MPSDATQSGKPKAEGGALKPREFGQTEVPAAAMQFEAGPFTFAEPDENGNHPVRMMARSGKPINHWYWGQIAHDMAGVKHKDRVPIDHLHWRDEVLGYVDDINASNKGLECGGALVPFKEDDRASEIAEKGRRGVPYEASINFNGDGIVIEEVGPGATAQVNGMTFHGPGVIVREWPFRGVAITPYGADQNTKTEFSIDGGDVVAVKLLSQKDNEMPETTAPTKELDNQAPNGQAAGEETASETKELSTENGTTKTETPAAASGGEAELSEEGGDDRAKFTAELTRYVKAFGAENGAKWFSDGKTFAEALELHGAEQAQQLAAKDETIKELNEKLSSLDTGETEPAEFSEGEGASGNRQPDNGAPQKFELQLGKNLAAVARGIRMPGASPN